MPAFNFPVWKSSGHDPNVRLAKKKVTALCEHFEKRFPEQRAAVSALTHLDTALRAILGDYEEIRTWLAAEDSSMPRDPGELEQARALARDLEIEILNRLEKQD